MKDYIKIDWNKTKPYHYGMYKGECLDGTKCVIDVDWKIKVFNDNGDQIGTDAIKYWFCKEYHIASLVYDLERLSNEQ